MKTQTAAQPQHTHWIRQLATSPRARKVGAVLTGFCGLVALVSATGKLTNKPQSSNYSTTSKYTEHCATYFRSSRSPAASVRSEV